jgi:tetratricopeptide (TPR) repeat protein
MLEFNGKDTFKDRVNIVLDELALGIRWERPSLILVTYRSEHIKNTVQAILAKSLGASGKAVIHYKVDKVHYDIPLELLGHSNHEQAVFFISGLRWGGGRGYSNAYRALNMHREYFVEGNIKAIFWLNNIELKQITRFSPDFWAFRHKVIEFSDLPSTLNAKPLKPLNSTLHDLYNTSASDFQGWIDTAEKFYAQGCIDEAIRYYRKALRKYPDETAISLQIAEIYLSLGRFPAASRILKRVNRRIIEQVHLLSEVDRLTRAAHSLELATGGFLDQTA